jgi:hypothetical protein
MLRCGHIHVRFGPRPRLTIENGCAERTVFPFDKAVVVGRETRCRPEDDDPGRFEQSEHLLEPGLGGVFYTDAVHDAVDASETLFGKGR